MCPVPLTVRSRPLRHDPVPSSRATGAMRRCCASIFSTLAKPPLVTGQLPPPNLLHRTLLAQRNPQPPPLNHPLRISNPSLRNLSRRIICGFFPRTIYMHFAHLQKIRSGRGLLVSREEGGSQPHPPPAPRPPRPTRGGLPTSPAPGTISRDPNISPGCTPRPSPSPSRAPTPPPTPPPLSRCDYIMVR